MNVYCGSDVSRDPRDLEFATDVAPTKAQDS
jgi:hypothetical protein